MPNTNNLFSIVVPVYNVENYLSECLDSLVEQANELSQEVEILLIDDGSKDDSGVICDRYAKDYPEIVRCFHKENEGLLLTRRYGFQRARGEYIVNCDSDDVMERDALSTLKITIEERDMPDVILFNSNLYDGMNKNEACKNLFSAGSRDSEFESYKSEAAYELDKESVLTEFMHSPWVVSMWGKIFKKSCLDLTMDYGKWGKLSTGEDTLQTIEIFDRANSFVYLNKSLYDYRIGSGMTGKYDPYYYQTFRDIFKEIENRKANWNMRNFDNLLSEKVLGMTGRAITQSRYNEWRGVREHVDYLRKIRDDDMLRRNLPRLDSVKQYLQKDHYILLKLMEHNCLVPIVILLNMKNRQVSVMGG